MADTAEQEISMDPLIDEKPIFVRVKRKAAQPSLDAFWLEINQGPLKLYAKEFQTLSIYDDLSKKGIENQESSLKRPLLDVEKLSILDNSSAAALTKEVHTKRVFVQHVQTVRRSEASVDVLQSFLVNPEVASKHKAKGDERRHALKNESKHDKFLERARQEHMVLTKNTRFEQIWRSRKGKQEPVHDNALHESCHLYDVVRFDVEETSNIPQVKNDTSLQDHMTMCRYLPLLKQFIPDVAKEIESDTITYMSGRVPEDYVYDLYVVKNNKDITDEDASHPFPLVQVGEDVLLDAAYESENETDDSNAEDNPPNEYPDEYMSEAGEVLSSALASEDEWDKPGCDEIFFPDEDDYDDDEMEEDEIEEKNESCPIDF